MSGIGLAWTPVYCVRRVAHRPRPLTKDEYLEATRRLSLSAGLLKQLGRGLSAFQQRFDNLSWYSYPKARFQHSRLCYRYFNTGVQLQRSVANIQEQFEQSPYQTVETGLWVVAAVLTSCSERRAFRQRSHYVVDGRPIGKRLLLAVV